MNPVLQSIEPLIKDLKYVKIDVGAVAKYGKNLHLDVSSNIGFGPFDISHFSERDKLHLLLLLCATNFCYWGEPKWSPNADGQELGGQWGNIFCLLRSMQQGMPLTSAEYLAHMTKATCEDLYRANAPIPLLHQRFEIFQEIGRGLQKYHDDFRNFLQQHTLTWTFLKELAAIFPSFNDVYNIEGEEIVFYKRSQLLVAFIENFFPGTFQDYTFDSLTAFADYKQPIALHRLGLITIDPQLEVRIRRLEHIPEGSREEIELRAVQVWICELIRRQLVTSQAKISASLVSTHFWLLAKEKYPNDIPHHRTLTIRY